MMKKYSLLAAKVLLAILMGSSGVFKLMGVPEMHESFAVLGFPIWFGYFIGASEAAIAVGVFFPPLCLLSTIGSVVILLGAIYYHLAHTPVLDAMTAFIGLLLSGYIFIQQYKKK